MGYKKDSLKIKKCSFFSAAGRGRPAPSADLVHENPLALVLPFPLHQVSEWISPAPGADLVHEMPLALVIPFPLHQVLVRISQAPGANLVLNL